MYLIELSETPHKFEKQNLVTIKGKRGGYDILKCKACGLSGRTYQIGILEVSGSYSVKKVHGCKLAKTNQIRITECRAIGRQFANLKPGTVHDVVPTPEGESEERGVWVMGVGEPVKVLHDEYEIL